MHKNKLFYLLIAICFLLGNIPSPVTATQDEENQQTIPTRTPVPPPTEPPSNGGGNNGGSNPNPNPPPTAVPPTATFTPSPVPLNINLEECESPAFVADLGTVNVRNGPGVEYTIIQKLEFAEITAVSGRASSGAWWRIDLENNNKGWVADETGTIYGNISLVNIVEAPLLDGVTLTPGPAWNPTPNPQCPTATPTATSLPVTATPTGLPVTVAPTTTAEVTEQATLVRQASTSVAIVVSATPSSTPTATSTVAIAAVQAETDNVSAET
ncbi:MAG: SH3 domain-containing protein, partial [Anaerolineales bacterium]|nr:SH3 domain-containing protein [Anaerolineales bacterium]